MMQRYYSCIDCPSYGFYFLLLYYFAFKIFNYMNIVNNNIRPSYIIIDSNRLFLDILRPVIENCPLNETHYIKTPAVTLNWTTPTCSDTTIHLTSNYPISQATFPWGEFFIQYVATKPSNGLRSECVFTESIYRKLA